jgi:transcriptional regulator with XRE-family HTH domain
MDEPRVSMLGSIVRGERRLRGWSINRLERETGVDKSIISRLESGATRRLTQENLERLAEVLEIRPDVLRELGFYPSNPMSPAAQALVQEGNSSYQKAPLPEPEVLLALTQNVAQTVGRNTTRDEQSQVLIQLDALCSDALDGLREHERLTLTIFREIKLALASLTTTTAPSEPEGAANLLQQRIADIEAMLLARLHNAIAPEVERAENDKPDAEDEAALFEPACQTMLEISRQLSVEQDTNKQPLLYGKIPGLFEIMYRGISARCRLVAKSDGRSIVRKAAALTAAEVEKQFALPRTSHPGNGLHSNN